MATQWVVRFELPNNGGSLPPFRGKSVEYVNKKTLQSHLAKNNCVGFEVESLDCADGSTLPLQENGNYYARAADFPPGEYKAFLVYTRPTAPAAQHPYPSSSQQQQSAEPSTDDDEFIDQAPVDTPLPVDDFERAKACVEALYHVRTVARVNASDASGADSVLQFSQAALLVLGGSGRGEALKARHDFVAAALTCPDANLRYLVAVGPTTVVVAVDASAYVESVLGPGAPIFVTGVAPTSSGANTAHTAVNSQAHRLASSLPFATLVELCRCSDEDVDKFDDGGSGSSPAAASGSDRSAKRASHPWLSWGRSKTAAFEPRRLIFVGYAAAGPIAHLAAILARHYVRGLTPNSAKPVIATIRAMAFASPFCVTRALAEKLTDAGEASEHYTLLAEGDLFPALATLTAEVSAAREYSQDTSIQRPILLDAAIHLNAQAWPAGLRTTFLVEQDRMQQVRRALTSTSELQAACRPMTGAISAFQSGNPDYIFWPLGNFVLLRSVEVGGGILGGLGGPVLKIKKLVGPHAADEAIAMVRGVTLSSSGSAMAGAINAHLCYLRARIGWAVSGGSSVAALAGRGQGPPSATTASALPMNRDDAPPLVPLNIFVPTVTKCTRTLVGNARTDFVLAGSGLEPLIGRDRTSGGAGRASVLSSGAASLPLRVVSTVPDAPPKPAAAAAGGASGANVANVAAKAPGGAPGAATAAMNDIAQMLTGGSASSAAVARAPPPPSLAVPASLVLDSNMFVTQMRPTEARIVVLQGMTADSAPTLVIKTDFGVSRPFTIAVTTKADPPSTAATMFAQLNSGLLEAAFLRGVLQLSMASESLASSTASSSSSSSNTSINNSPGAAANQGVPSSALASGGSSRAVSRVSLTGSTVARVSPILVVLQDLEEIVVSGDGKAGSAGEFVRVVNSLGDAQRILLAQSEIAPTIARIVNVLSTPVQLQTASSFSKFLLRVLGAIGTVVGGVLTIAGGVVLLPIMVPFGIASAFAATDSTAGTMAAVALGVPSGLAALVPGLVAAAGIALVQRSLQAMQDPASQQYIQMLKILLRMLGGDPSGVLEEVTSLEAEICKQFTVTMDGGGSLFSLKKPELRKLLDAHLAAAAGDGGAGEAAADKENIYHSLISKSRDDIAMWLAASSRLALLRRMLQQHVVISFVGVHNAGKSTFINRLFGIETHADLLSRTETANMFHLSDPSTTALSSGQSPEEAQKFPPDTLDDIKLTVDVVDFPGASDERQAIATISDRLGDITTLFVCVFAAGHIARPELEIMNKVRRHHAHFIVLINKIDQIYDEVNRRGEDIKADYARRLNIDSSQIFLVSSRAQRDVERVRSVIFGMLKFVTVDTAHADLAWTMLHMDDRRALVSHTNLKREPMARLKVAVARVLDTMGDSEGGVTASLVEQAMQYADDGTAYFVPRVAVAPASASASPTTAAAAGADAARDVLGDMNGILIETLLAMGYSTAVAHCSMRLLAHAVTQAERKAVGGQSPAARPRPGPLARSAAGPLVTPAAAIGLLFEVVERVTKAIDTMGEMGYAHATVLELIGSPAITTLADIEVDQLVEKMDALPRAVAAASGWVPANMQAAIAEAGAGAAAADGRRAGSSRGAYDGVFALSRLRMNTRFGFDTPIHGMLREPSSVYPDLSSDASLLERLSIFQERLKAEGCGTNPTPVTLSGDNPVASFMKTLIGINDQAIRGGLRITISGDEAIDLAGVLRSLMTALASRLSDGSFPLVKPYDNRQVYVAPAAYDNLAATKEFFRGLGRAVGLCLQMNVQLPHCLALPFFKMILGRELSFADLEAIDVELARSVRSMCLMDHETFESLELNFSATATGADGRVLVSYDLIRDGGNVTATRANRSEYIWNRIWFALGRGLPFKEFVLGVNHAVPLHLLSIFSPPMMQLLVNGPPEVNVDQLKAATDVRPQGAETLPVITWFWELVEDTFDDNMRGLLLTFATGSSVMPPDFHFHIRVMDATANPLPMSHTCFNLLDLPNYPTKELLKEKLLYALQNTTADQFGNV